MARVSVMMCVFVCMWTGFSWQDEITQRIIAKELSRIPHTRSQKIQNAQWVPETNTSSSLKE